MKDPGTLDLLDTRGTEKMEARDLYRMNVIKLREEAMMIPGVQETAAMKKAGLIKLLAKNHGIILATRGSGPEQMAALKKRIRTLKANQKEAMTRKDLKAVSQIRRGIRTLKRHTRDLARAIKQGASVAASSSSEPPASA